MPCRSGRPSHSSCRYLLTLRIRPTARRAAVEITLLDGRIDPQALGSGSSASNRPASRIGSVVANLWHRSGLVDDPTKRRDGPTERPTLEGIGAFARVHHVLLPRLPRRLVPVPLDRSVLPNADHRSRSTGSTDVPCGRGCMDRRELVLVEGELEPGPVCGASVTWMVRSKEHRMLSEFSRACDRVGGRMAGTTTTSSDPDSAVSTTPRGTHDSTTLPSAGIVIANFNGERDLPGCLTSLRELDYPRELVEVIVVDNGSTDESVQLLARDFPWVTVIAQDANLGFAPAVNIGAAATSADCLVLLNNDMQVEPGWLRALVDSFDPDQGYVCVGGMILDWDGTHVDFVDGVLNWHGMGDQVGFGRPLEHVEVVDGRELLFACGGAMLVDRAVFNKLGGLDPDYFAYFEDVDLGWRLWLSGYKIRLAANARCRHRHNGTSARFPFYQRALLYERNALRTMLKNVEDEHLGRLVGPAVMLIVQRALGDAALDRTQWTFGTPGNEHATDPVSRNATARLHAVGDLLDDLESIMQLRRQVQLHRTVPDSEVFRRFGQPFKPLGAGDERFLAASEGLRRLFRIEELFDAPRATRIACSPTIESARRWPGRRSGRGRSRRRSADRRRSAC